MGEAILSRASGAVVAAGGGFDQYEFKTETITSTTTWLVPEAKDQSFTIRIFGGGGGGSYMNEYHITGGGGGYMNNGTFTLTKGQSISIQIGAGGQSKNRSNAASGGTSSFGGYLSAAGGSGGTISGQGVNGGSGGASTRYGGSAAQFGAGGGGDIGFGGQGGNWGGGGG